MSLLITIVAVCVQGGAGLDTISLEDLSTEPQIYEWVRSFLLEDMQSIDWQSADTGYAVAGESVQESCADSLALGLPCTESYFPVFDLNESTGSLGTYRLPYARRTALRKYNLIVGGTVLSQSRGHHHSCAEHGYLDVDQFSPMQLSDSDPSPNYKCYHTRADDEVLPGGEFSAVFPRAVDRVIGKFAPLFDADFVMTGPNQAASKYPSLLGVSQVTRLAKMLLHGGLNCEVGHTVHCGCGSGNNASGFISAYRSEYVEDEISGSNSTALFNSTASAHAHYVDQANACFNDTTGAVENCSFVRKECTERAMQTLGTFLGGMFKPDIEKDEYQIYIPASLPLSASRDILNFAENHGWISHRRDCHLMAPPCNFIRCFNRDKQGGVIK